MSNVIGIKDRPIPDQPIGDMSKGQVGYTVPWAFDGQNLDEGFTIHAKGGTCSLRVECVKPGLYSLTFETPKYKDL